MEQHSQRTALGAFLANNPELHRLTAKLSQFNLFDVLRASENELRHSNVLAWLMNPDANHTLGDSFLRRFLSRCLLANQERALVNTPMSAADIELADFNTVIIHRERRHIDILVVLPEPYHWVFVIENKIRAGESKGQLRRYHDAVAADYPDWKQVGIFLTLDGHDASDDGQSLGYIPFSHEAAAHILEELISVRRDLPPAVKMLIDHYLQTVRRLTMSDPEIVELCKTIYKKHRRALDLIMEYGASSDASDSAKRVLESAWTQEHCPVTRVRVLQRTAWFIPAGWEASLQKLGGPGWSEHPLGMLCFFHLPGDNEKVGLIFEVGPMDNHSNRIRLLKAIQNDGFRIPERAFEPDSKYTRIYRDYQMVKDGEDEEVVLNRMWKKATKKALQVGRVLDKL